MHDIRTSFFRNHLRTIIALLFLVGYSVTVAYATPPASPYVPGETLDPACAPSDVNCTVQIFPDQTGNNGKFLMTDGSTVSWSAAGDNSWLTTGNAGTTSSNFLGTTDNKPLIFRTNNQYWGFFDSTSYNNIAIGKNALPLTQVVGPLGVTGDNVALGTNALASNTGGWWNIAMGLNALQFNTTGYDNIAIGKEAMQLNQTGIRSIAMGNNALNDNINGVSNIAIGSHSMEHAWGNENTVAGMYAMSGGYNLPNWNVGQNSVYGWRAQPWGGQATVAVGYRAHWATSNPYPTFPNPPKYSIAIGYQSLYDVRGDESVIGLGDNTSGANSLINAAAIGSKAYVGASNSIVLGSINGINGATADTNVGIGTTTPAFKLHIGSSSVVDGTSLLRLQDIDSVCDFNANAGAPACGSDITLKKDISSLSTVDLLSKVSNLNPVSYHWLTEDSTTSLQYGFIAQEVAVQFPDLVSDHTWIDGTTKKFLNMGGLMPYAVGAIKEMNLNMLGVGNLARENSWRTALLQWFADTANGITRFFANEIETKTLCVSDGSGKTCITRSQLDALLQAQHNSQPQAVQNTPPAETPPGEPTCETDPTLCPSPEPEQPSTPVEPPAPDPAQ